MGKRRPNDFYPTGGWLTEKLLQYVPEISGRVFEPCAGEHDMVRVLAAHPGVQSVATNDVDPGRTADFHLDARDPALYQEEYDWIVTNPPFSVGFEILQQAHARAKVGVAFLLRLSFIEPTLDRGPWFVENPPTKVIVMPRYSFTRDGNTDSVTCAWFVWRKGDPTQKILVVPRGVK